MSKKRIVSLLLALAMLLSLCACGQTAGPKEMTDTQPADPVTVTDMIGRQVDVTPGEYTRVVCIGAGALRQYSYIGDMSLLCGVEDIDNITLTDRPKMFDGVARPYVIAYSEVLTALPSCGVGGPNAQAAEAEKILSCAPDIVISQYEDADKADALQAQLGVPVITLRSGPDGVFADELLESLTLLGQVFGREQRAQELIQFIGSQRDDIFSRTAVVADGDKPGVYICGLGNWGTTNHLMTAPNYKPFEVANIRNAVQDVSVQGIQPIEAESFAAIGADMDVMIVDAAAVKNIAPLYAEDPALLDTCKAWQNGQVYLEMAYNAYYTNFELALANTWFIAKSVYPELFADVDMTQKLDEITEMFLGKPLAAEIFACPSSFGGYQQIDTASFFS